MTLPLLKSPSCRFSFLANRPTTTPVKAEAMTQLHHGMPPQDRSISAWPMKPIRPPATGPYMAANRPSTAYCRLMLVLGTGLGMATKRPRTKNRAAPIPTATKVLMLLFFMIPHSLIYYEISPQYSFIKRNDISIRVPFIRCQWAKPYNCAKSGAGCKF